MRFYVFIRPRVVNARPFGHITVTYTCVIACSARARLGCGIVDLSSQLIGLSVLGVLLHLVEKRAAMRGCYRNPLPGMRLCAYDVIKDDLL